MIDTAALAASLASLGLICAIYGCNILSPLDSWLRTEVLAATLLSLLTGLFPLALVASLLGLWGSMTGGVSLSAILSAGTNLVSIGAVIATVVVFRALVKATYRTSSDPTNVTPFTPNPIGAGVTPNSMKKAA